MIPTPESIATLIGAFGAIVATVLGLYHASKNKTSTPSPTVEANKIPEMLDRYRRHLEEIERGTEASISVLRDIRKAIEGSDHRHEKMVGELENMSRAMMRIENAQGNASHGFASIKHNEEMQTAILVQIREELKNLRDFRNLSHQQSSR